MSDDILSFTPSQPYTVGIELELQILNARDYNLARDAEDLIGLLEEELRPGAVKPEITESMIELNSSVHRNFPDLLDELVALRKAVVAAAQRLNVRIAGGGSHAFHKWSERRIYPTERFKHLLEVYGYLAKQFTVFGQHVHVGCEDGDTALYLIHALSRYMPHFIALSASSPFQQGEDTAYQSSRLNTVSAFPLSGQVPFVHRWSEFEAYYGRMLAYGIAQSMKDFYWDIRPKPEYGTVEIRVFDTPLTLQRAAQLAAYAQTLARYVLEERPFAPAREVYELYSYNRFQACRYGANATIIDAYRGEKILLRDDILETLRRLTGHAETLGNGGALEVLAADTTAGHADAEWLRARYRETGSLNDVTREQSALWMDGVIASDEEAGH